MVNLFLFLVNQKTRYERGLRETWDLGVIRMLIPIPVPIPVPNLGT